MNAQLPVCDGADSRLIYFIGTDKKIYNLDPSKPLSATNPVLNTIALPPTVPNNIAYLELAVCNNISGGGPSPTFYSVDTIGNYIYYDGTQWVTTYHYLGSVNAPNIGGGGGYIYSFDGGSGDVYKYDGTSNSTFLTKVPNFNGHGPIDITADCNGNFYILKLRIFNGSKQELLKYNSSGTLVKSWNVKGAPSATSGGGFAILGNRVYYDNYTGYYEGVVGTNDVTFRQISASGMNPKATDFAGCPFPSLGSIPLVETNVSSVYTCDTSDFITVNTIGNVNNDSVSWNVLNGGAVISGNGDTITVKIKSNASIELKVYNTSSCGYILRDTVFFFYIDAKLDAGLTKNIVSCKNFRDTLNASLLGSITQIPYKLEWQPYNSIVSGGNTLSPIVSPTDSTTYRLTVTTSKDYGSCNWTDTVSVLINKQVEAFLEAKDILCADDTNFFIGSGSKLYDSLADITYTWYFGDGTISESADTFYQYKTKGDYNIMLVVADSTGCSDTAYKLVKVYYPPYVSLGNDTSICEGMELTIPKTRTDTGDVTKYIWSDGYNELFKTIRYQGLYTLTVSNECGVYTDQLILTYKDCSVWFPSAFTPNNDGFNDIVHLKGKNLSEISSLELIILNRFGEVVFRTNDYSQGWDGTYKSTPAELGMYYYMIRYKIGPIDKYEILKGDILLMR